MPGFGTGKNVFRKTAKGSAENKAVTLTLPKCAANDRWYFWSVIAGYEGASTGHGLLTIKDGSIVGGESSEASAILPVLGAMQYTLGWESGPEAEPTFELAALASYTGYVTVVFNLAP